MLYDIRIILIKNKFMIKKSQIIKRWKKKYLGKWNCGNATQGQHGYNLLTCFCRDSREDFNHTLIHVVVLSAVCNYYSHWRFVTL